MTENLREAERYSVRWWFVASCTVVVDYGPTYGVVGGRTLNTRVVELDGILGIGVRSSLTADDDPHIVQRSPSELPVSLTFAVGIYSYAKGSYIIIMMVS